MKTSIISMFVVSTILMLDSINSAVIETHDGQSLVHFGYKTDNGHSRTEDIKFNNTLPEVDAGTKVKDNDVAKPVEYRGGYSFISADGYEYTVLYKANKNGFQPYVTARKIQNSDSTSDEKKQKQK